MKTPSAGDVFFWGDVPDGWGRTYPPPATSRLYRKVLVMVTLLLASLPISARLFVSSIDGSDRNRGDSPSRAFRTLERLQEEVRQRSNDHKPVQYVGLKGRFFLRNTLELGPEFSGVTIEGQTPKTLISGGTLIDNLRRDRFNGIDCYSADVPGMSFNQLFRLKDGERLSRSRLPRKGFYQFAGLKNGAEKAPWNEGQNEAVYAGTDMRSWLNLKDVEVVVHHLWNTSRLPIDSVDESTHTVKFTKKSVVRLTDDFTNNAGYYALENVPDAVLDPGQWYLDRGAAKLYYLPTPAEASNPPTVVAPALGVLARIRGAHGVRLKNLQFEHSEWNYPADSAGDVQAAVTVPGAVQLVDSTDCRIEDSGLSQLGTYAVEIDGKSFGNMVTHSRMSDLGAGGIKIGHGTERTTVSDSVIEDGGKRMAGAIGIWIGSSGHNVIAHNLIQRMPYTGISVGWSWGYGQSSAIDNRIEANVIRDIGMGQLSDMGAIYTLGVSPGTVLLRNRIDNVRSRGYGGWGIYFDEGSTGILAENNVVTHCKTGSFHQHYGENNMLRNNIFAFADQDGQLIRSRAEDHRSFTLERNVVLWKGTPLLGGNWTGSGFLARGNLFWKTDGPAALPADWVGTNVVGDPLFANVAKDDFRLRKGSPAHKIDFVPINLKDVGPRN